MRISRIATAAALLVCASSVQAEGGPGITANVGLTSDYVFRGISQNDEDAAIQFGADATWDSFYLGVWGSQVEQGDADYELDIYGGLTGDIFGLVDYDIGLVHYLYPSEGDNDYTETKVSLGHDWGFLSLYGSWFYSSDFFAGSGNSHYFAIDGTVAGPADITLHVHAGRQSINDEEAFFGMIPGSDEDVVIDWGVGASKTVGPVDVTVMYTDTNLSDTECFNGTDLCEGRFSLTVGKTFELN